MPLPAIPAQLPKTQQDWTQFVNVMQSWQQQLQVPQWQTPTFNTGWSNQGAPYAPCGYRADSDGRVWLRGVVTGPIGTTIFALPTQYAPTYSCVLAALESPGAVAHSLLEIEVMADGTVTLVASGTGSATVSLDGLSFSLGT